MLAWPSDSSAPIALAAGQVSLAALLMVPVLLLTGVRPASQVTPSVVLAMVALGVAFLDESVSWNQPVGGLVVLAGVAVAQGRARLPAARRRACAGAKRSASGASVDVTTSGRSVS